MNEDNDKRIVIIAGEVSGDIHGGKLVSELFANYPRLKISGIGGEQMIEAGLEPLEHIRNMAFLGFGEIIRHLPFIRKIFKKLLNHIRDTKPDAVVLIDYPGFNLHIARAVKSLGIPVIYYISPQLWAWGKRRVRKIKRYVDKMLVIFPFEVKFYDAYGIEAEYVGHPLVDSHYDAVKPKKTGNKSKKMLGLLPGSRLHELQYLLPDMVETARRLYKRGAIDRAVVARVSNIDENIYNKYVEGFDFLEISNGSLSGLLNSFDAALVSSGTATLETAYFRVPMVIVYRVSKLTWRLGKLLVKLNTIGLANIVAGDRIAAELLQDDFRPESAAALIESMLDENKNRMIRARMEIVAYKLGQPGASQRAAQKILEVIQNKAE